MVPAESFRWMPLLVRLCFALAVAPAGGLAHAQLAFERQPINYSTSKPTDPVANLVAQVDSGKAVLKSDPKSGYLVSLLNQMQIPVSSQTLVFSKTSHQRHLISPSNPRAIYFNDEIYVGWVPQGELIEIASVDSMLGTNFYTIEQDGKKQAGSILRRTERCLFCHASSHTGRIPGLMMQSIYTGSDGNRIFPADSIWAKPDGPLETRWGGWFVTGTHGKQQHLGNLMIDSDAKVVKGHVTENANVVDLSRWFDVNAYLSPHSDLVALLVLQHQVSMHNVLTDANHLARLQIHSATAQNRDDDNDLGEEDMIVLDQIAERVVDGLLMVGAIEWSDPVSGTSEFAREFSERGPWDSKGRSLRTFDLQQTLFHFPCSYLIYSDSFDALPRQVLAKVHRRLRDVLESKDKREKYGHLSPSKRRAISGILRETKPSVYGERLDGHSSDAP